MSKIDWYGILFCLLVPTIVVGLAFSMVEKDLVSMSGWLISAVLLTIAWIGYKRGGVLINLQDDKPTSGILAALIAGFIGGVVFFFLFLNIFAPMILAVLR